MDAEAIGKYILDTFDGVKAGVDTGNSFFFCDPQNKIPFITIVMNDKYDDVSDLNRDGVFRLNIGIGKTTYRTMFPAEAAYDHDEGPKPEYDFTAIDRVMPHPAYAKMFWVCVLNPSDEMMGTVRTLLAEAYEIAVRKYERTRSVTSR